MPGRPATTHIRASSSASPSALTTVSESFKEDLCRSAAGVGSGVVDYGYHVLSWLQSADMNRKVTYGSALFSTTARSAQTILGGAEQDTIANPSRPCDSVAAKAVNRCTANGGSSRMRVSKREGFHAAYPGYLAPPLRSLIDCHSSVYCFGERHSLDIQHVSVSFTARPHHLHHRMHSSRADLSAFDRHTMRCSSADTPIQSSLTAHPLFPDAVKIRVHAVAKVVSLPCVLYGQCFAPSPSQVDPQSTLAQAHPFVHAG